MPLGAPASVPGLGSGAVTAVLAIARLTALEAARGRFAWLVAGFVIAGSVLAVFAAEVAITETQGYRSGILGAWLRSCAVFALAAFVVSSAACDIRDKWLELVLSMPVSRAVYYAGKLTGFAVVAVLSALACGLAVMQFASLTQSVLWAASLGLELLVVTAMSLLCVFTFTQIAPALSAVLGFYVLSRSVGDLQLIAHAPAAGSGSMAQPFIRAFIDALAHLLPNLGRFTESAWLIHGAGTISDLAFAAAQAAVYVAFLAAAALFDLYRRAL